MLISRTFGLPCVLAAAMAIGAPALVRADDVVDLSAAISAAPKLDSRDLGQPMKATRAEGESERVPYFVPNPDGKTYTLLLSYDQVYGGPNDIAIVNLANDQVKMVHTDRKPNAFDVHLANSALAPNGKLFISILDDSAGLHQMLWMFDPQTGELKTDALSLPEGVFGETHPICTGPDGMIYCAGKNKERAATVIQIDPNTLKMTDYGAVGPSHLPSDCWGYYLGVDDQFAYVASGKIPWYLVALNLQTHKSEVLATTARSNGLVRIHRVPGGFEASVTSPEGQPDGSKQTYFLYHGKAIPETSADQAPPWPMPAVDPLSKFPPRPGVLTADLQPDADGNASIWWKPGPVSEAEAHPTANSDADLTAAGWRRVTFKVPLYAEHLSRIYGLADGKIIGAGDNYTGMFVFDPKTNEHHYLGGFPELSMYSETVANGKLYFSGYPDSQVFEYDPSKPWTLDSSLSAVKRLEPTDPSANPRRVCSLNDISKASGAHKMYSAAVGADGRVYFGGRWYRDGYGGGFGWYNPSDGSFGGIWKEFSNEQIVAIAAADSGKTIVISTEAVRDDVLKKPTPEQGSLFFYDTAAHAITGQIDLVKNVAGPGVIVAAPDGKVIGWTNDPASKAHSILYSVDAAAKKVTAMSTLSVPLPVKIGGNQNEAWDFKVGPDGFVWTFLEGNTLARINPADLSVHVVGHANGGNIAFSGADVYVSNGATLHRLHDIIPRNP